MNGYLVDSNFFIQAHRAYYPLDIAVSFWSKTAELAEKNLIRSIDKVKAEIYENSSHEDKLKEWCQSNLPNTFFIKTDTVLSNYIQIVNWAYSKRSHYKKEAIDGFLTKDLADPWLVAYAMSNDFTIVTYEKSEPNGKRRIKIPEVCNHFNISYTNTVEMLRELRENF